MQHIISLGAGVQSSTMALMAAHGEIGPMPIAAIFADTGWESKVVYRWLEWLKKELPFPVYRVRAGGMYEGKTLRDFVLAAMLRDTKQFMPIPVFTNENGKTGMTKRQCTRDWKIRPIERKAKEIAGLEKGKRLPASPIVTQWIGISLDEIQRAKPSREKWKTHRHPLAYELQFRRKDCLAWMTDHGYPEPPRSACIGCPFHDQLEWWQIRQNAEEWEDAVSVDEQIRNSGGARGQIFLHSSARPLTEAVPHERPPTREDNPVNLQLFNECEGMCGV